MNQRKEISKRKYTNIQFYLFLLLHVLGSLCLLCPAITVGEPPLGVKEDGVGRPQERCSQGEDTLQGRRALFVRGIQLAGHLDMIVYRQLFLPASAVSHLLYNRQDKVPGKDSVTLLTPEDLSCKRKTGISVYIKVNFAM